MIFAWAAKHAGLSLHVCNMNEYGWMMGLYPADMTLKQRHQAFTDTFVDHVAYHPALLRTTYIKHTDPETSKKGFDEVNKMVVVEYPVYKKNEIFLDPFF